MVTTLSAGKVRSHVNALPLAEVIRVPDRQPGEVMGHDEKTSTSTNAFGMEVQVQDVFAFRDGQSAVDAATRPSLMGAK